MEKQNNIVNIGRQLGSGGHIVAKMLAEKFGFQFYDREILNIAAKESGFDEKFFEQNDEHKGFLKALLQPQLPHISGSGFYTNKFSQDSLFQFQSDAIRKAANQNSCVFVGRCADYVLRDFANVINVFVTAPLEARIKRVSERRNCSNEEAKKFIVSKESERAAYYNFYTGKQWGNASSYDICINTDGIGMEETTEILAQYIHRRLKL